MLQSLLNLQKKLDVIWFIIFHQIIDEKLKSHFINIVKIKRELNQAYNFEDPESHNQRNYIKKNSFKYADFNKIQFEKKYKEFTRPYKEK